MEHHYIKCLEPKFITNRYTGKTILIECGKCEHCLMKKSLERTQLCKLESACYRYHYFVTLTYANEYLPKARLFCTNEENDVYDVVRESDGYVLGSVKFPSHLDKMNLIKKCGQNNNQLPLLDYYDVQLFLKRLRKRIRNEKIRYFVCGEYGPIHFRPHYHLCVWFNEEETSQKFIENLHQSWTFGRIDASLSTGKSASYVASYVNSNQYLPRVFKLPGTAPFSHHSFYLGEQFYSDEIQKYEEIEPSSITKKRIWRNGINTDVFLWRSLKNRLFPKLKGFASQSEYERVLTYKAYAITRDWTKETSPISLAKFVTDYVKYEDFYHPINEVNDFLQLLRYGCNYYKVFGDGYLLYVTPSIVDYDKFQRMVYMILLQSRRFLKYQCKGDDSYGNVSRMIRKIDDFYKYQDSVALKTQLEQEQEDSKQSEPQYVFHNTLILEDFKESRKYLNHKTDLLQRFESFTKHKKLNDLNKIFNY